MAVLQCGRIKEDAARGGGGEAMFECVVVMPLTVLYDVGRDAEVRGGALRVMLHVLERHGEKLHHSWADILELLRQVAGKGDKDHIPLGFSSVQVLMNDCLPTVPHPAQPACIEVTGSYAAQTADVNISLTAVGLLWTVGDFFAKSGDDTVLKIYGVLRDLSTDGRPEVRNSALRTLFQSLVSHGSRMSTDRWHHCLWDLIFPLVESVRHLASTASAEEWVGTELGKQGGVAVHMLVHHSRNTHQKQWDETLVVALSGLTRLLKAFFPLLQTQPGFKRGWDIVLQFVEESCGGGSKEVALAAITALHVTLHTHAPRAQVPRCYWESSLATYEVVLRRAARADSTMALKARQETVESLGELYLTCPTLFHPSDYLKVLALLDTVARYPSLPGEAPPYQGTLPQLQRTVLDCLPKMQPQKGEHTPLWTALLRQLLAYLPGGDRLLCDHCIVPPSLGGGQENGAGAGEGEGEGGRKGGRGLSLGGQLEVFAPAATAGWSPQAEGSGGGFAKNFPETSPGALSAVFVGRVLALLVALSPAVPEGARMVTLPDTLAALGRCMSTRRDHPDSAIWRTALTAFCELLQSSMPTDKALRPLLRGPSGKGGGTKGFRVGGGVEDSEGEEGGGGAARSRLWRELADIFDKFLVGACGRAVGVGDGKPPPPGMVVQDEGLENRLLETLCGAVLGRSLDASAEVKQRLVAVLDRCALRTTALPPGSVALLPPHCTRFSLACLRRMFSLAQCVPTTAPLRRAPTLADRRLGRLGLLGSRSKGGEEEAESSAVAVGRVALPLLLSRCHAILRRYAVDVAVAESDGPPLPTAREDEVAVTLQEAAGLELHPLVASCLRWEEWEEEEGEGRCGSPPPPLCGRRAHLLLLYGPICNLLGTRELRIQELLRTLLRLLGIELGLLKDKDRGPEDI